MSGVWILINDTAFVWDGSLLLAEVDQTPPAEGAVAPRVVRSYAWGRDLSGSLEGAGGVGGLVAVMVHSDASSSLPPRAHFAQADGRGNVVALWESASGTATAVYEYGPFGEKLRAFGEMALTNPLRWSSKYDDGNGLVYFGYRYYNPDTGRWLSRDPIEEDGGVNLYGFVNNDPISAFDILGLLGFTHVWERREISFSSIKIQYEKTPACKCDEIKFIQRRADSGEYSRRPKQQAAWPYAEGVFADDARNSENPPYYKGTYVTKVDQNTYYMEDNPGMTVQEDPKRAEIRGTEVTTTFRQDFVVTAYCITKDENGKLKSTQLPGEFKWGHAFAPNKTPL